MSDKQTVWIDVERCTGCGVCVEACPVEAIGLRNGVAHVDEELCTGCEACIAACPDDAIQPVVYGELVTVPERPAPTVRQPSPLAETAGAAVVAAGAGLLAKAAEALAQAVSRWLTQRPTTGASLQPRQDTTAAGAPSAARGTGRAGRGRRARHRRRGG